MIENHDEYLRVTQLAQVLAEAVTALVELPDRRDLDFVNAEWRALLSAHYQSQRQALLDELAVYGQLRADPVNARAVTSSRGRQERQRVNAVRTVTQEIAIIEQAMTVAREQYRKLRIRQPSDGTLPPIAQREIAAHETVAVALRAYRDEMLKDPACL